MKEMIQSAVGKCTKCTSSTGGVCKMESPDVTITFCQDGAEWSHYLSRCLQHESGADDPSIGGGGAPLHVHQQALEELPLPLSKAKVGFFLRAKAHVVVVSPNFLDFVLDHPSAILGELFEPSRVLALMCGVRDTDVVGLHRASLAGYDSWHRITVEENDSACVQRLMDVATELLRPREREVGRKDADDAPRFRLSPCKAREGSAKITIEFVKPVPEGQIIAVTIDNECESISLIAKRYNPYNAKFVVPDRFFGESQIVEIKVTCDVHCYGSMPLKCESKMAQLNQLLQSVNHPLSFMCETLGLSSSRLDDLDRYLVDNFKKNISKSGFSFLDFNKDVVRQKVDEELPTLLHWAAKMGFRELCSVLLDCVGAAVACRIQNCRGLTASDIAEVEGHSCLANMLENYAQLAETAEMYIYMKSMAEDGSAENYENLRAMIRQNLQTNAPSPSCPPLEPTNKREEPTVGLATPASPRNKRENKKAIKDDDASQEEKPHIRKHTDASLYTTGLQELLEIQEDFKQDKYSLAEVELLFRNWQMRQKTNSFEEKQEQLKLMRQQYEHMQNKCQQDNKKTSTLGKFWSFLSRNVKKDTNVNRIIKVESVYVRSNNSDIEISSPTIRDRGRPQSTWSAGSSSLSDRSSTMSGLSVSSASDSGALSDIGEENASSKKRKDSAPKPLIKAAVPKMVENMQYMFVSNQSATVGHGQRSLPKMPVLQVKSSPLPSRSKKIPIARASTMPPPVPPPRWVAGSPSAISSKGRPEISTSPRTIVIPVPRPEYSQSSKSPIDIDACDRMGSPTSVTGSPKVTTYYMHMDSVSSATSTNNLHLNSAAVIIDEPDYYNVVCSEPCDYVDMRSQVNLTKEVGGAPTVPQVVVDEDLAGQVNYANIGHQLRHHGSDSEDHGERCDSVPDSPPPPPPALPVEESSEVPNQSPPPVPPRNV